MDEVEGVGEAAEVGEGPVEGVAAVGAVVDGDEDVPAAPPLAGLAVQLHGVLHDGDQRRQHHLPPVVLHHLLIQRLHEAVDRKNRDERERDWESNPRKRVFVRQLKSRLEFI